MGRFEGMEVFAAVVEAESFTEAARRLGMSKSYVSKRVRELEDRLGTRLMNRTTRRLSLTDTGQAYYDRCRQILDDLDEVEQTIGRLQHELRGRLKLSVPMSFGLRYLMGAISEYMIAHPGVEIDLVMSDRMVDIIDEGFDLVVRIGSLRDSAMIARRLAPTRRILCAAPSYVERRGAPRELSELREHDCILYRYQRSGVSWNLHGPEGESASVKVSGRLRVNNGDALVKAQLAGLGIGMLPDFMVAEELRRGELTRILPDWCDAEAGVWAIYPHSRHLSAKVRSLVEALVKIFSPEPPWELVKRV